MFSIVREPCANNSFHTPLAEHVLLYMTTRNLSIPSMVSELTSTGCRDRSKKASIADGLHGSDYQFAKSLSCTMRNVEQNARICLLMGTWLEILDIPHVILCGDERFILCTDDHLSASFACMYAIGQIAIQFIFVSITSQESLPVRQNRRSFKHALSLRSATVHSTIDCFRLFVRYLSQTIFTLLTVSS